jgi:hypothetical protein
MIKYAYMLPITKLERLSLITLNSRFWLPDIWDCNPANRAGSYVGMKLNLDTLHNKAKHF